MSKKKTPQKRTENLVVQEHENEVLIYDLKKDKAFCLNQTSALVWQACDGNRTIADISDEVGKQLNSKVNEDMIWLALDQLSKEGLVEKRTELDNKFNGLSRREVIKKIGLGTMVALPIVTSLVAPTGVHAQTCSGNCTCTINGSANIICTIPAQGSCTAGCVCRRVASGNTPPGYCGAP